MQAIVPRGRWEKLRHVVSRIPVKYLYLFFLLMAVVISLHSSLVAHDENGWTRYNNFLIFKSSWKHLIAYKDLYLLYPAEYYDLYKYSPSFALWMGLFAWMPDVPALISWNVMNVVFFIWAMQVVPVLKERKPPMMLFLAIEMMIALTSSQINVMIGGALVLAWHFMENKKVWAATLLVVITIYIKIFGIVALSLFLLYPERWKAAAYTVLWTLLIGLMPLLVVSWDQMLFLYKSWGRLLGNDYSVSYGVSVMGWWHTWFNMPINKQAFVLSAAAIFTLPFIRFRYYREPSFRLQILCSILLWVVIFNHKGESPTYILAMMGVAIWYFSQPLKPINTILVVLTLVFTSFSSTDLITPYWIARTYIEPFAVKAVFCSVVWLKIILESLLFPPLMREVKIY
ncbi:MAG TPA: glycosyltransferase family 87 protein [Chitinophaga sp.]|uniref:glycosyltransferase family 87 protein n=1 Tax=Chitinophaga sp. TaxID=1869181 RepID=UPI002C4C10B4|nr:glycosyltransferase family 87 protein [Chitinophaga sp.]HVI46160.1 glycosyltransferase family 87 protein [Chitinophaga sp.]